MKQKNALKTALAPLRLRWSALAQREQNLLLIAASVVLLALLWWVALAPALSTLRAAPEQHRTLDAQLQRMQALQAQAQALQAQVQDCLGLFFGQFDGFIRAHRVTRIGDQRHQRRHVPTLCDACFGRHTKPGP